MHRSLLMTFAIAVLVFAVPAGAQPTINWNQIPRAVGVVEEYKTNDPLESVPVEVGNPGGPQTWTFDTSFTGFVFGSYIVDKDDTPFGPDFPDANLVSRGDDTEPVVAYEFARLNEQAYDLLGIGMTAPGADIVVRYDSAYRVLSFPVQMGNRWYTAASYLIEYDPGTFSVFIEKSHVHVDAWGTAELPFGSTPCLRVNFMDTLITLHTVGGVPEPPDTFFYRQYHWWAQDLGMIASAWGPDSDTSLVFTESDKYNVKIKAPPGAVADQPRRPANTFQVASPFVNRTTVPGRLNEVFELYDVTGKLVARQPGNAIGSGLPAGIYTVRSGSGQTARIVKLAVR